jgi:hypothetical protein
MDGRGGEHAAALRQVCGDALDARRGHPGNRAHYYQPSRAEIRRTTPSHLTRNVARRRARACGRRAPMTTAPGAEAALPRFTNQRAACPRCGRCGPIRVHFDRDCAEARGDHFHRSVPVRASLGRAAAPSSAGPAKQAEERHAAQDGVEALHLGPQAVAEARSQCARRGIQVPPAGARSNASAAATPLLGEAAREHDERLGRRVERELFEAVGREGGRPRTATRASRISRLDLRSKDLPAAQPSVTQESAKSVDTTI